ncbi:cyclic AMP-dependent transcription factor ATF-1, partial [Silurus asotus]
VEMEEIHQSGSNGTESQSVTIPTTITASQLSQITQMTLGGSPVAVVQLPGGQLQVQGVIQSAQSSVIQSPPAHVQGQGSDSEDSQDSSDSGTSNQKTRELLARRPSYRKILNDLSAEEVATRNEEEEETMASSTMTTVSLSTPIYQTSSGQYFAIASNGSLQLAGAGSDGVQGLQTLTMTNSNPSQPTILQYAQTADGQQILLPSNQVVLQGQWSAGGECVVMCVSNECVVVIVVICVCVVVSKGDLCVVSEVICAWEAARECRRKKKEYVKCLENRVAVLENQNKTLIEELKTLKDLYCVKTG